MINELHQLSVAMQDANITTESWHREYKPIPAIRKNAPCVRIVISGGKVERLEGVDAAQGEYIRKYGNNQGSFPAMNLAPLYRIGDKEIAKELSALMKRGGQGLDVSVVKTWCTCNNWCPKFSKKYHISMRKIPGELLRLLQNEAAFTPVMRLIESTRPFADPEVLHKELENQVIALLEKKRDMVLALQVLLYVGKDNKKAEDDYGSLSVVFDDMGQGDLSSTTLRFTKGFNQALLCATTQEPNRTEKPEARASAMDAFGLPFTPSNEPMPAVKLAGGFTVSLRTMFHGQPCQYRYGRIENDTYPIADAKRQQLKDSLEWLGSKDMQDKTWVNTDKKEILFVYPSRLPKVHSSFTRQFRRSEDTEHRKARFEAEAEKFRDYVSKTKEVDMEHYPDNIQIFVLRQIDKARTKVVYTRCTTPDEIILHSDDWQKAARNLPPLHPLIARPWTPFPLEIANIMNCVWKRDGTLASDKYKPVVNYHGMELLFNESRLIWETDLRCMVENTTNLAVFAGVLLNTVQGINRGNLKDKVIWKVRDTLVLMGMFLYWLKVRKGDYMNEYPYLLGQMLKVSDSLHELYCHEVRGGEIPPQLIGSGLYVAASETPIQALAQLGKRMSPYLSWARTNQDKRITVVQKNKEGKETTYQGPTAGYLRYLYEKTADSVKPVLSNQSNRFNDYEKALLFIGYLASFPKNTKENDAGKREEEMGGTDNE